MTIDLSDVDVGDWVWTDTYEWRQVEATSGAVLWFRKPRYLPMCCTMNGMIGLAEHPRVFHNPAEQIAYIRSLPQHPPRPEIEIEGRLWKCEDGAFRYLKKSGMFEGTYIPVGTIYANSIPARDFSWFVEHIDESMPLPEEIAEIRRRNVCPCKTDKTVVK